MNIYFESERIDFKSQLRKTPSAPEKSKSKPDPAEPKSKLDLADPAPKPTNPSQNLLK